MSHVVTLRAEINNLEALKRACVREGVEFCEGATTYRWAGYWADDSPVPRHLFASEDEYQQVVAMTRDDRTQHMQQRLGRCDHVIKVPGASHDVGVIKVGNSYQLAYDYYCDHVLQDKFGFGTDDRHESKKSSFLQSYALERAKMEAQRLGHTVWEKALPNGAVELHIKGAARKTW